MHFIDTHTHLFLPEFDEDRQEVIERALKTSIQYFFLPNIDIHSIQHVRKLSKQYPENCFPLMGLHPSYVQKDFENQIKIIETEILKEDVIGIGEIGLDFYWDKTYKDEQIIAFKRQLEIAIKLELPVVIHVRNSFDTVIEVITENYSSKLKGIFHCFTGSYEQATKVIDLGFHLGIGGIVTFKNSGLDNTLSKLPIEKILLETDSPYLAPVPFRGKRNESAYIIQIAQKLADIYGLRIKEIASITNNNAANIFSFNTTL